MSDWNNTTNAAALQKKFSDLFFETESMTSEEKQEMIDSLNELLNQMKLRMVTRVKLNPKNK